MSCRLLDRGKGNTAIAVAYGSTILAVPPAPRVLSFALVLLLVLVLVIDPLAISDYDYEVGARD
jgi:hypothetical protein